MNRDDYLLSSAYLATRRSAFTKATMKRVGSRGQLSQLPSWLMPKRLAFGFILLCAIAITAFSSYAYAIGTDPVHLIQRIIKGNTVEIHYDGRTFRHGTNRSYSDVAVTAAAELSLVEQAKSSAADKVQVPENGVEYVDNPALYGYENSVPTTLAYLTKDNEGVHAEKVYRLGDKVISSETIDDTVVISSDTLQYFESLKRAEFTSSDKVLIAFSQEHYLKHIQGSGSATTPVTMSFAFRLTHPLEDFKAADPASVQDGKNIAKVGDERDLGLVETNFGAMSTLCINNGADTCGDESSSGLGESLYGYITDPQGHRYALHNPNVVKQGEALIDRKDGRQDLIMRALDGHVEQILPDRIVIKTSSGALWTLSASAAEQSKFKQFYGTSLMKGDRIQAHIYESVSDLDDRSIAHEFIYDFTRIK